MAEKQLEVGVQRLSFLFPKIMKSLHGMSSSMPEGTEDITLGQVRTLINLYESGPISLGELSRLLNTAQSSTSQMVGRLVRLKLVTRRRDVKNRRAVKISLSERAHDFIEKKEKHMNATYRRILRQLSPEDQRVFLEAFENIYRLLGKSEELEEAA